MNEACEIDCSGGRCVCRACGASWQGSAEAGPCGLRPASVLGRAWTVLRPRGLTGLVLWSLGAATVGGIGLVLAVAGLEHATVAVVRLAMEAVAW